MLWLLIINLVCEIIYLHKCPVGQNWAALQKQLCRSHKMWFIEDAMEQCIAPWKGHFVHLSPVSFRFFYLPWYMNHLVENLFAVLPTSYKYQSLHITSLHANEEQQPFSLYMSGFVSPGEIIFAKMYTCKALKNLWVCFLSYLSKVLPGF